MKYELFVTLDNFAYSQTSSPCPHAIHPAECEKSCKQMPVTTATPAISSNTTAHARPTPPRGNVGATARR